MVHERRSFEWKKKFITKRKKKMICCTITTIVHITIYLPGLSTTSEKNKVFINWMSFVSLLIRQHISTDYHQATNKQQQHTYSSRLNCYVFRYQKSLGLFRNKMANNNITQTAIMSCHYPSHVIVVVTSCCCCY